MDRRILCILFGFQPNFKAKGSVYLSPNLPYSTLTLPTRTVHQILQVLKQSVARASPSYGVLSLKNGCSRDDTVCKSILTVKGHANEK